MMKKFIRLLDFELGRFLKFLLPTYLIVAVLQLFSTISTILNFNRTTQESLARGLDAETMSLMSVRNITQTPLFSFSIVAIILVFIFYSFFIWYREWLGKNAFIYRLLMLPVHRSYIFLTKALTFLIGGFLSFVFQFGMYALVLFIAKLMVEPGFYQAVSIHNIQPDYEILQNLLFPQTGFEFFTIYGFAFGALVTLFAAILMERSFRIKGLIAGVVYLVTYFALYTFISSINYYNFIPFIIKPSEAFIISAAYLLFMILLGTLTSRYLLNKKIKV